MAKDFIYDAIPYPSFSFPQTRPDRLSTIGLFYGIETATPDKCRVLELGCGNGTNLISFAYTHPESSFLGIDLSSVHIEKADDTKQRLGLNNIEFQCRDILATDPNELGKFDFVIAHGLFSWVPDRVRERILTIYSECLAHNGVGYISYNAYPGFHVREIIRHIMRYHTRTIESPLEKVEKGVEIIRLLSNARQDENKTSLMFQSEFSEMLERTASNIFHDDLSELNRAFYFEEFCSLIADLGLQFLSEADLTSSTHRGLSKEARELLDGMEGDVIRQEQYLDFIKNRRFRSSLICSASHSIKRGANPEIVRRFRISSQLRAERPITEVSADAPIRFHGNKEQTAEINHPLTKIALDELSKVWPRSLGYDELLARVIAGVHNKPNEADIAQFNSFLRELFLVDLIKFHRFEPQIATEISERPHVSDFARWQIEENTTSVTTMTGMNLEPDSEVLKFVALNADGTRTANEIAKELRNWMELEKPDKSSFPQDANPDEIVERALLGMLSVGLIVG